MTKSPKRLDDPMSISEEEEVEKFSIFEEPIDEEELEGTFLYFLDKFKRL